MDDKYDIKKVQKISVVVIPSAEIKIEFYNKALKEIKERVKDVDSLVSRMATIASVLRSHLPYYLWCGFYFAEENKMVVGPYQGSPACANISYQGVCGTSVRKKETIIVPNVHEFPGHIICDESSNSEIVVPLFGENGMVIAVLDVDSKEFDAFDETDKNFLEKYIMSTLLGSY